MIRTPIPEPQELPWYVLSAPEIAQSVIAGLIAGVAAGWVLERFAARRRRKARDEQVLFIRTRISDGFAWSGKFRASDPTGALYRYQNFQHFLNDLQIIVNHQTDSLSAAERCALHRVLYQVKWSADSVGREGHPPTGSTWYQAMYDYFVELDWLDLEERLPWE